MTHATTGYFKLGFSGAWGMCCLIVVLLVATPLQAAEPYRVPPNFYPQVLTIAQHVDQSQRLSLTDTERQQLYLFILARCSAVGLTMMKIIDTDVRVVQTSRYLKMKGRDYWIAMTVRAVQAARAVSGGGDAMASLDLNIEQARMFMKIYRHSLSVEAQDLNRGLLVDDAISCARLIGVERTVS